ncbi:hypothetical protein WJX81_001963 [Elliptochloris bilobata]|uniref:Photolyase/cryptochrome alpha/beta domain-containing protein n=1 Tax=Elliptochloris bilobata TaxID=381761 RepID=A0AAW1SDE2_9CHLO
MFFVASGKGGVGKSTTAVNLAVAMAAKPGMRVGLLDADVHGPSVPRMMHLSGRPQVSAGNKMVPLENYRVRCMSMGFLMQDDVAAVWRGPMVMSALEKFVRGVEWGELDDIALIDARRGVTMFNNISVAVLGIVENMSYYACPACQHREYIFGQDGAKHTATELGLDLLGEVPLNIKPHRALLASLSSLSAGMPHQRTPGTVLLWFRRDLRVADNPALIAALQTGAVVVPVYVWAAEEEGQFQPGRCSRWWLHYSLLAFEADLAALGARLVYRRAPESRIALLQLIEETGAQALFFNHLYDPISLVRDNEIKAAMAAAGVHCRSFNADVLFEPWLVLAEGGRPDTCCKDYWNRAMSLPFPPPKPLPPPLAMRAVPEEVVSVELANLGLMTPEEKQSNQQLLYTWTPGSKGAHVLLDGFVRRHLAVFDADRAKTDRTSTSRLSPHVHFGEISVRFIFHVVKRAEAGGVASAAACAAFLQQMGYREYARYLSYHFPFTHERSLLEHLRAAPWRFDQGLFKAWRQGRTGYPLVDAGLRELWSTGWMHNRSRVVCASFLVKNLLLPWQWGLKHYWDAQLDADLESDALGWQYVSGCLADAKPFSHMLDHAAESARFDPEGRYVRRWLPVLARLPAKWIHRPWEAPPALLADAGVELGVNYPLPLITLEESRAALARASAVIEQAMVPALDGVALARAVAGRAAAAPSGAAPANPPEGPPAPKRLRAP